MTLKNNIILDTDSYKILHGGMYPEGLTSVYSYFESRNGALYEETPLFGLQYIIKNHLEGQVVTQEMINEADEFIPKHFGSNYKANRDMWQHIVDNHDGKLPIRIRAIPEGLPVPVGTPLITVENTDDKCYALTNHLETFLTHIWYPSTVCARSRNVKKILKRFLDETADDSEKWILDFQLHDFGYRGASCQEAAACGGAAHLVNFKGTDTIAAMRLAKEFYGASYNDLAYSVPASEHSVMTALGQEGEEQVFLNLLKTYPNGILSIVSDSYNIENFIRNIASKHKEKIVARGGKVVFRPDSLRYKDDTPARQMLWIWNTLWDIFGGTTNNKGFKVLHPKVGTLWGDGIDENGVTSILQIAEDHKYSTSNVVFGMGGNLLQKLNRDTQRFAFKASSMTINGVEKDIFKNPRDASKASKKGKFTVLREGNTIKTVKYFETQEDLLIPVFENGKILKEYIFEEIRKNANL